MSGIAVQADATIHRQVLEELKWDTRVDETGIGVEVDNGVVTLTGYVDSHAKRAAAAEAAHRVVGVLDVANDITVQAADALGRTDTQIAQSARDALDADPLIRGERIETTVSDGWVTLRGRVDCWRQSEDAERTVLRVPGVRGVVNELTIRPQRQ
jgi:osmotically-inducible protein OsmY